MSIPIYAELKKTLSESLSMSSAITKSEARILSQAFSIDDESEADLERTLPGESFNFSDSKSFQIIKVESESFSFSDQKIISLLRTLAEEFSLSDDSEEIKATIKILTESLALTANFLRTWEASRIYSENYNLTDSIAKSLQRQLSEQYSLVEDFLGAKITAKELVESLSLSESKILSIGKSLIENISISDGDFKLMQRIFSENFGFSGTVNKGIQKTRSEGLSLSDSRITLAGKNLAENYSFSATILKDIERSLSESLSLSDGDNILNYIKVLSESFNINDKFIKFISSWLAANNLRTDIQSIIQNEGISATLIRQTETTDSQGGITSISEQEYTIYMAAQDIIRSDRQIHDMGIAKPGSERVFMFHEYPNSITGNGILVPEVGDLIKDDEEVYWRIEEITGEREMDGSEIFKSALIRKVDLT